MPDPAFPDALPALSRLHWYVVERVLGQGGFGITYLARDTNLDQAVAIKEYLPVDVATRMPDATIRSRSDDLRDRYRWGLERFIQEARTLARFDHPNIVRVQSVFEFNNTAYMVMRFEQGLTLSALLDRRGTLPERDLLRIVMPILDGLELVHGAGFIHRDIKPDNIHIRDDGNPVLLDFGSARQALGSAHTLTILIAPGYAPFEQYYSDASSQGPWTDIYGLGATCYRAIAGRPPLDAVSRSKGILGSTQEVLVPASVIGAGRYSGNFLAAIDHALAFAEKDRPQSITAWRTELVAGHTHPPAATEIVSTPPAPAQPAASSRAVPAAGVAVPADARATGRPAIPAESRDTRQPPPSRDRKPLVIVIVIGAGIVAVAIAAYLATMRTSDETRSTIAALQRQLQDKEIAAEAERARIAKQQVEDEARKRQEARTEQEKSAAESARKQEDVKRQDEQKRQDQQKRRDAATAKQAQQDEPKGKQPSGALPSPSTAPPVVPALVIREAPVPQPSPAAAAQPPAASPEPPKPSPARTPAEQIVEADRLLTSKQYGDALAILQPLADAGNAQAQTRLGNAYAEGQGVKQNYETAVRWYEKAALQREINAQLKLGAAYASGTGVGRDNNLAYVWYGAAARLGSDTAKAERDKVATLLQPAEREQADRLIESRISILKKQ